MGIISGIDVSHLATLMRDVPPLLKAVHQVTQKIIQQEMKDHVETQAKIHNLTSVEIATVQLKLAENRLNLAKNATTKASKHLRLIKVKYLKDRGFDPDSQMPPMEVISQMKRDDYVKTVAHSIEKKCKSLI